MDGPDHAWQSEPEDMVKDALAIVRLSKLSSIEYDRVRKSQADRMQIRVDTLDAMVRKARDAERSNNGGRAAEFSDDDLAVRFTERHGCDLRYVAAWGRWFQWTGQVWKSEDTLHAFDLARAICRTASKECEPEAAPSIASAKTVAAVERLARADRGHAATVDQWDKDRWRLNTPTGAIDLRSGDLLPHNPDDHFTKITAVGPDGDCPLWLDFLKTVTAGDDELQGFLQRVAGYALTGDTSEHALFFGYGTGGNGKGVFLNTLTGILGDYATVAPMEAFTARQGEQHPTELAMLRGARLVTSQETEEGKRWAESRIKALTGGDPITARFMHKDFFTYTPQFKLIVAGNHKPALRNVDEAIRRRLHMIPFSVKIAPEQRDPMLPMKLKGEWPGILGWAVEGCLEWQRRGLAPPPAVTCATEEYLGEEDATGRWLDECCDLHRDAKEGSSALYDSWRAWAEQAGEPAGSQKRFSQALQQRGFTPDRLGKGKAGFTGLKLNVSPPRSEPRGDRE